MVHSTHEAGIIYVYAVTISGVLYILRIRTLYKYRSISTLARSDIMQLSLVSELGRLDEITALNGVGEHVCVGGKSGSIFYYFVRSLNVETKEHCVELKDSDAILGRLWGLVARAKRVGSVQSLKVQTYKSRTILFALHEDGIFKLWDLYNQSRLLNFNLYKGDSSGFIPKTMWVQEHDIGSRSTKVAFLFQKEEATNQNVIHIYDLQHDQVDGAGGQAALNFQSQTLVMEGTVKDLKLLSDRYWKLYMVDGQFHLNCYSTKRLKLPESWEIHSAFHVSLLRPYMGNVPEDMPTEEQPEVEELGEILVPEQLSAHKERKVKGKAECLASPAVRLIHTSEQDDLHEGDAEPPAKEPRIEEPEYDDEGNVIIEGEMSSSSSSSSSDGGDEA
ncbi:hypothetical protein L7F22_029309 [Adiantum nelumboides]|nr:hypothetical protein [Adiantum nelumboides]